MHYFLAYKHEGDCRSTSSRLCTEKKTNIMTMNERFECRTFLKSMKEHPRGKKKT